VLSYPGIPARWRVQEVPPLPLPVLPTEFRVGPVSLKLFSMLTTFGTPQDITTDELRVESFYPADAASEALLRGLAGDAPREERRARPPGRAVSSIRQPCYCSFTRVRCVPVSGCR